MLDSDKVIENTVDSIVINVNSNDGDSTNFESESWCKQCKFYFLIVFVITHD